MGSILARNWWAFALRGVLGILFGIIAFWHPLITMLSLVIVFAAYAITDGIFAIIAAVRAAQASERWWPFVLEGLVDIAAGVLAFIWPHITILVLVIMVAVWALITGALMLGAAFRVHPDMGRWWFVLGGVASIVFGIALVIAPMVGAFVLTWWIGAYAFVFGIAMFIAAFRLRSLRSSGTPHAA